MRRLTTLICAIAIVFGLLVFLFFPRSAAPAMMFKMSAASSAPMTGFSERVGFEQVARITQNTEVVAHVTLTEHGKPMPPREIYLRGMTLDIYTGRSLRRPSFSWQWIRSDSVWESGLSQRARAGVITPIAAEQPRRIHQHISLLPTGSATLFALDGVYAISPEREMDVHYFPSDGTIRANDASNTTLNYDVISSGTPPPPEDPAAAESHRQYRDYYRGWSGRMLLASRIDDRIKEYAMRPEVSGQDEQGPLAQRRGSAPGPQPLDEEIADSIARYLQRNFSYTLDLTDVARDPDTDPIAAFLYDFKRGHCEYFAGSMALMCQSLGMKSRVVIGFRAGPEDFNSLGGYYVIRQSHAHAWTEVLTSSGWKSYDPTAATYFARPKSRRVFATLSDIFDLLQYKWASAVVTYNNEDRKTVWAQVESGVGRSFSSGKGILSAASDFLQSSTAYELSTTLIGLALAILVLILMIAVGVYIAEKRRLYRRAQRIGLSSLPTAEQLRLARQLGFYDEMLRLLVRHQIVRSPSMTPREFATSLSFLAPEAHEQVCRVTDLFYRVRYGGHRITSEQRRRLYQVISEIALSMPTGKTNHRLTVSSAA